MTKTHRPYEIRAFPLQISSVGEDEGIIEGYASIFGELVPSYNEIVEPGAFKRTLKATGGKVPVLAGHREADRIGMGTHAEETQKGLFVVGELLIHDVQRAKEEFALIKQSHKLGRAYGLSIGFETIKKILKDDIFRLIELKLWEWAPVSFPAAPNAGTVATRSLDVLAKEIRSLSTVDFEALLRFVRMDTRESADTVGRSDLHRLTRTVDALLSQLT